MRNLRKGSRPMRGVVTLAVAVCGLATFGAVTITPGEGWTPVVGDTRIEKGSAVDFSRLCGTRKPAGAEGRVVAKGAHFEFERRPGESQRFYGVNFCFTGNFMSEREAEELCARLERLGYNSIRIHHYEKPLCENSPDGTTINPKRMAELDNLLTAAIRHGLYVTTDLYVSRAVPYRACGIDREGLIPMADYKELALCNEGVFSNLVQFSRAFLGHVNPKTGRRWADEPALAFLALINEGNPGNHGLANSRRIFGVATNEMNDAAFVRHLADCQRRFDSRMIALLREEIGYRGLITNLSCWNNPPEFQEVRKAYDYVDDHFYVDHPKFLEKRWALPSSCRNANPITYANAGIEWKKKVRLEDRPYTITEWNFSGPGRYRGAGGIVFGAGAALQDMAGVWRFAWCHGHDQLLDDGPMRYFNAATDPLMLATERAIIALYLRGDMPVDRAITGPRDCSHMSVDRKGGSFALFTDRTCGVFAEPSATNRVAGALSVVIAGHSAAVWATALDGRDLGSSRRILVTHVTDVQDAGTVYRAADRKVLETWGKLPHLMANGTAEVTVSGALRKAKVYALNADGTRRGEVKSRTTPNNGIAFTADVARDSSAATYLYEIIAR